jgi:Smg protein
MKETILDVLMFMFQSYVEDNEEVELDKESLHKNLSDAGFSSHNIEKAFDWLEGLPGVDDSSTLLNKPTKNSFRLFSDAEHMKIGEEGLSFLMFLERLGIFHGEIREHVIDRIMALDTQKVDLSQIKWVVLMILFNTPGNESNYTWLQNLNSDKALPYIH